MRDLDRAIRFYVDALGFEAGNPWPADNPSSVIVRRGDVLLQFDLAAPGDAVGTCTLRIMVDDVLPIHAAVKDRARIDWGPEVYWYGRHEFWFRDPDGYRVIISAETSDPVECEDDA